MNVYGRGAAAAGCVVVIFWDETGIVLFAVSVRTFAEPIFVSQVVAILAFSNEATFPSFMPTFATPLAVGLCRTGLFLPGVVPHLEALLNVVGSQRQAWPLVIDYSG